MKANYNIALLIVTSFLMLISCKKDQLKSEPIPNGGMVIYPDKCVHRIITPPLDSLTNSNTVTNLSTATYTFCECDTITVDTAHLSDEFRFQRWTILNEYGFVKDDSNYLFKAITTNTTLILNAVVRDSVPVRNVTFNPIVILFEECP